MDAEIIGLYFNNWRQGINQPCSKPAANLQQQQQQQLQRLVFEVFEPVNLFNSNF